MLKNLVRSIRRALFDEQKFKFYVIDSKDNKEKIHQFTMAPECIPQVIEHYIQEGIRIEKFYADDYEMRVPVRPQVTSRETAEVAIIIHEQLKTRIFSPLASTFDL